MQNQNSIFFLVYICIYILNDLSSFNFPKHFTKLKLDTRAMFLSIRKNLKIYDITLRINSFQKEYQNNNLLSGQFQLYICYFYIIFTIFKKLHFILQVLLSI